MLLQIACHCVAALYKMCLMGHPRDQMLCADRPCSPQKFLKVFQNNYSYERYTAFMQVVQPLDMCNTALVMDDYKAGLRYYCINAGEYRGRNRTKNDPCMDASGNE